VREGECVRRLQKEALDGEMAEMLAYAKVLPAVTAAMLRLLDAFPIMEDLAP
jgi:hypothetical protein